MGLKHLSEKKKSAHPIIEAQRETPKLLNNQKKSFKLKINRFIGFGMVKNGGSNLLNLPTSNLSVRGQNHSCISSKFTFSHNFKNTISQERIVLER